MRLRDLWRTTTFRLTSLYGAIFVLVTVVLLASVYSQSAAYLTRRVDGILTTHANSLERDPPELLRGHIDEALALNADQNNVYALFSARGAWITGNLRSLPAGLTAGGRPVEIPATADFPTRARLIARRLPSGDILVVGRDVKQLRSLRAIIGSDLAWSGASILIVGLACGVALSIPPLRRLQNMQSAASAIAGGDLKRRMPAGTRRDELDIFADAVNTMMGEIERLMVEVKSSTDTIAHDLRTPLTRARARLHRLQQSPEARPEDVGRITAEIDEVLDRFRAILRISELESRERRAGFSRVDLADIIRKAAELYLPLAEEGGLSLSASPGACAVIDADPKLLFEAVSNLLDNAIKFTGSGGTVRISCAEEVGSPTIVIRDTGPGIPEDERSAVLSRFYRSERDRLVSGSGLGLSVVAAIVRLHGFELQLEDARPGLRATIRCRPPAAA